MSKTQPLALLPLLPHPRALLERRTGFRAPVGLAEMVFRVGLILAALTPFAFGGAGTALAQTAAPATAAVPAPSCEKPSDPPRLQTTGAGREEADRKRNSWLKSQQAYVECLKRFLDQEQAEAASHMKAVNATAEELNKAVKAYNEQAEAVRQ
jgi:hypothetical protein